MTSAASAGPPLRWPRASGAVHPTASEVHVWAASLDLPPPSLDALAGTLAPEERERAARVIGAVPRARYIAARGQLREILGAYLRREPRAVVLTRGPHGKPALDAPRAPPLHFNVSHSGSVALYAFSSLGPVGIDVEAVVPSEDLRGVASRFFSPTECIALSGVPPAAYPGAFFRCWTRKEAYLKARGIGLLAPLDGFDVSVQRDEAALLRVWGDRAAPQRWSLTHVEPAQGYVGALAVECPSPDVRRRAWAP